MNQLSNLLKKSSIPILKGFDLASKVKETNEKATLYLLSELKKFLVENK